MMLPHWVGGNGLADHTGAMSTVIPPDQSPDEGFCQGSTEEHAMSSHPHTHFIRARRRAAAAAAGVILASAGVAWGSAANQAQSSVARATPLGALRVGATSRAFVARMDELKAQGYVETACMVTGALMFNPYTHQSEIVSARPAPAEGSPAPNSPRSTVGTEHASKTRSGPGGPPPAR
jgi:hypothetical protein